MPRKPTSPRASLKLVSADQAPDPIPAYIDRYLATLEAQLLAGEAFDRDAALRPLEAELGRMIDIEAELKDFPEAQARFGRVWRRVQMRIEDGALSAAEEGKASAMPVLRGMGGTTGDKAAGRGSGGGNGRLQLEREHRDKGSRFREGW